MKREYVAVCLQCYTSTLGTYSRKIDAERTAVSHMNAYGHKTSVQDRTPPRKESLK